MEPRRSAPGERGREQRAAALRRRTTSIRVGAVGLVLLFASSIATILFVSAIVVLLALMLVAVGLIVVAFLLIRTPATSVLDSLTR